MLIEIECTNCKKKFLRHDFLLKYRKLNFCSKKCHGENNKNRYKGEANPFYGKHHSKETKLKIAETDRSYTQTSEYKEKISKISKEKGCGGLAYYKSWVKNLGKEGAKEKEKTRLKKISIATSGPKNKMFGKPAPIGAGNGCGGWYKNWYFRSLRELAYMINVIEAQKLEWLNAENQELSISYIDENNNQRTYRADFLINNKILIEIKPLKLQQTKRNIIKKDAAIKFCLENGLEYQQIDIKPINTQELKELIDKNLVKLNKTSQEKFKKYYEKWKANNTVGMPT